MIRCKNVKGHNDQSAIMTAFLLLIHHWHDRKCR